MLTSLKRAVPSALVLVFLAVHASAQVQQVLREYPQHGFRLKAPATFKETPLEPLEKQILVKLTGTLKSAVKEIRGEQEIQMLVIRIAKSGPAVTGSKDDLEAEDERGKSLAEQKAKSLNSARTFAGFLEQRYRWHEPRLKADEKPFKSADGKELKIVEVSGDDFARCAIRGYLLEDEAEIFGLVTVGEGIDAFKDLFKASAKTLERVVSAAAAKKSAGAADPYEGSTLRGLDVRRQVRAKLVAGWSVHDTENFILVTNATDKKMVADLVVDLEVMRGVYEQHFPPIAPVEVVSTVRICATMKDYMRYGGPPGTGGYWNFVDEELVLFDPRQVPPDIKKHLEKMSTGAILYHEAMHQYHHYSNGQAPPASWFNEGYGEYFGGAVIDRSRKALARIEKNKFRMDWVKSMQRTGMWPHLKTILKSSQGEFYGGNVMDNYAMGWSLCWFLEQERHKKDGNPEWQAITENYLKHLRAAADELRKKMGDDAPKDWIAMRKDEIQEKAFEATFGKMDLDALEAAWMKAMQKY